MCDIGKKMYRRRKELGLTLEEVGDAVGVGKSTVRRWENGMIKNMGRDKIAALARVLRMSPVEFVPGDDAPAAINSEDQQRLEALHQNPALGLLFDRSRKMSHDDVEFMLQMADRILKERDGE
jgi:transcriptional regulator with XRE-family HTH domain